jgi:hypothetical protein
VASFQPYTASATWPWPTYTTGSISSTTVTWNQWLTTGTAYSTTAATTWQAWNQWHEPVMYQYQRTEEELRRLADLQQQQREEYSRRRLAEQQRIEGARAVARSLLDEIVAPTDWVEGLELIQVLGSDGHLYRIELHRDTVHGNIVRVDEHGCILGRACIAPSMRANGFAMPMEDGWLGQYLGLKFHADEFLRRANWSGRQPCRQPNVVALPVAA